MKMTGLGRREFIGSASALAACLGVSPMAFADETGRKIFKDDWDYLKRKWREPCANPATGLEREEFAKAIGISHHDWYPAFAFWHYHRQHPFGPLMGRRACRRTCGGDVRLYLDNMAAPAAQSDGSESWGCWGMGFSNAPRSHPFSFYNSPDRLGPWSLCRLNVSDSCNFRHVFRFEIEYGPDNLEENSSHSGQVFYYCRKH